MKQFTEIVYLICLCTSVCALDYKCSPMSAVGLGVSLPLGDIHLLQHSKQNLTCHLNPSSDHYKLEGLRSSNLFFSTRHGRLESEVLSDNTISTIFDAKEVGVTDVSCNIERPDHTTVSICFQRVITGSLPQPPVNFTCLSENWHNLNCSWDKPYNPVETHYDVKFIEPGYTATNKSCPSNNHVDSDPEHNCFLDLTTTPPYRQTVKIYTFYFNATNLLLPGGEIYKEAVNHYAIIKPGRAVKVNIDSVTPRSLQLSYRVPSEMHHFEPGLHQFIRYKNEWTNQWESVDTTLFQTHEDVFSFPIQSLQPYTTYTFEIKMISTAADFHRLELWSEPVLISERTKPDAPSSSPLVDVGSFEVLDTGARRTVFIYWKSFEPWQLNGPQFQYIAKDEGGKFKPSNITNSYAKFEGVPASAMTVRVGAANSEGLAPVWSVVTVPAAPGLAELQPRSLTKIWKGTGRFEVAWRAPVSAEVRNYTLFWCRAAKDRPHQCDGQLDWKTIQVLINKYSGRVGNLTSRILIFFSAFSVTTLDHKIS